MAGTSTQRPGIITWVNALRTTMANDPGRQTLHDQVQTNGFLFLDEYLDNILAGPKHDPIIELVKTPGRRKDLPKKTRAATAASNKAKAVIGLSLEDEDYDKENFAPVSSTVPINSFHKKLLEAKATDDNINKPKLVQTSSVNFQLPVTAHEPETIAPQKKVMIVDATNVVDVPMEDDEDEDSEEMMVENLVTPPRSEKPPSIAERSTSPIPCGSSNSVPMELEPVNDLSMIPETDESVGQSRLSITRPQESSSKPPSSEPAQPLPEKHAPNRDDSGKHKPLKPPPNLDMMAIMDIEDMTTTFTPSTSASTQTFHSIDLDSPSVAPQESLPQPTINNEEEQVQEQAVEPTAGLNTSKTESKITAAPFRVETPDLPAPPASPKQVTLKPGIPHFPTIGAPSPLRKSMRAPREPTATNHSAPGQKSGLTRSSWLVKAREAKAMQESGKRPASIAVPAHTLHEPTGSKRKSDSLTETLDEDDLQDDLERKHKLSKISETSSVHDGPEGSELSPSHMGVNADAGGESEGMINKLKKTVEGFSARAGKSMGKSLGGAAATALAEARAAAEAKIAERNGVTNSKPETTVSAEIEQTTVRTKTKEPSPVFTMAPISRLSGQRSEANRRLSVSDLVTKYDAKSAEPERVFKPPPPELKVSGSSTSKLADISTSTTPPNSPPRSRSPIFTLPNKPDPSSTNAPIFTRPPVPSDNPSLTQTFETFSKLRAPGPLSAQSTYVSTQTSTLSESIFDNDPSEWLPETQDTQFSDPGASQFSQTKVVPTQVTDDYMDADESWRDDKLDAAWMPIIGKDDSMTWSSNPTQSVRGDTGTMERTDAAGAAASESTRGYEEPQDKEEAVVDDMDAEDDDDDDDFAHQIRLVPSAAQSTVSLVSSQDSQARAESQTSNSNSQSGFLGTAARIMTSVLGGSKNRKPEPVKSIQLAAAVAKKQQEAEEKKAVRLKEMEARRQQIQQKKEEEKLREEKKAQEENDRRKREREDLTEKRALKQSTKAEEEPAKKRKVAETEKKTDSAKTRAPEIKKTTATTKIAKSTLTMQPNASSSNLLSKSLKQSSSTTVLNKSFKGAAAASQSSTKAKGKGKAMDDDLVEQPARAVQAQMQARVKAQIADLRKSEQPATMPSESIELPDINSEYSDSEDEDRVRTFDPPHWAQSPELRAQLQSMSTLDPDDIFGAIRPLKMEELFKTRTSRFRARTSSANWAGTDELTAHEEREYAKRMGYKK